MAPILDPAWGGRGSLYSPPIKQEAPGFLEPPAPTVKENQNMCVSGYPLVASV